MKINIFPTGMRLHEWIAFEEGYFREQGLEPEVMMDVYLGMMKGWRGGYGDRPQDKIFVGDTQAIGNACAWGSVCNAGAGMGKFVPDAYGIARHAIFVRPESKVRRPEDLRGVPVAVGLMAGSHYNVPYRLESTCRSRTSRSRPWAASGGVSMRSSREKSRRRACSIRRSTWRRSWG